MTVDESVSNMKSDLEIVDAIGVYNFSSNSFIYQDESLGSVSLIQSMINSGCFNHAKFAYLDLGKKQFFMQKENDKAAIILLKNQLSYNKILLEIASSKFLQKL